MKDIKPAMRYKDVEYTLVQTSAPVGWRWSFKDAMGREKSGASADRRIAIRTAERAIDKLLLKSRKSRLPPSLAQD